MPGAPVAGAPRAPAFRRALPRRTVLLDGAVPFRCAVPGRSVRAPLASLRTQGKRRDEPRNAGSGCEGEAWRQKRKRQALRWRGIDMVVSTPPRNNAILPATRKDHPTPAGLLNRSPSPVQIRGDDGMQNWRATLRRGIYPARARFIICNGGTVGGGCGSICCSCVVGWSLLMCSLAVTGLLRIPTRLFGASERTTLRVVSLLWRR